MAEARGGSSGGSAAGSGDGGLYPAGCGGKKESAFPEPPGCLQAGLDAGAGGSLGAVCRGWGLCLAESMGSQIPQRGVSGSGEPPLAGAAGWAGTVLLSGLLDSLRAGGQGLRAGGRVRLSGFLGSSGNQPGGAVDFPLAGEGVLEGLRRAGVFQRTGCGGFRAVYPSDGSKSSVQLLRQPVPGCAHGAADGVFQRLLQHHPAVLAV